MQMRLSLNAALAAKIQHAIAQRLEECPTSLGSPSAPDQFVQRIVTRWIDKAGHKSLVFDRVACWI
jgi:hypothetical protein